MGGHINQHDPEAPLFEEPGAVHPSANAPAEQAPIFDPRTGQRLRPDPVAPGAEDRSQWRFDPRTGQRLPDDPNRTQEEGVDYVSSFADTGRHDLPQRDTKPQPGGELARPEVAS